MGRFAAAGDDNAGPVSGPTGLRLHGGREVHGERDRTQNAVSVMHEANEFAGVGLADEVDHTLQRRMPVPGLTALDELDLSLEMVDDRLKRRRVPPLGREVELAAGDDNPKAFGDSQVVEPGVV